MAEPVAIEHKHSKWFFWFHKDCPRCWIRRFRYSYRGESRQPDARWLLYRSGFDSFEKHQILRESGIDWREL